MTAPRHMFTVVIASLCDDARGDGLKRACDSVRSMAAGHDYGIIVVANGPGVSPGVLEWLAAQADVHTIRLRSGSHPLARRVGAELADTEYLTFLDDDDELMPDTLGAKITFFREHPDVDVLATEGIIVNATAPGKGPKRSDARPSDTVRALMQRGWNACSLTVRAREIDLSVFDAELRHMEWTYVALALARRHKVGFMDEPTYRYHADTPNSLSKGMEHALAAPKVWRRLAELYRATPYRRVMLRRYGKECHYASLEAALRGKMRDAWHFYRESLRYSGARAIVPFSARFLSARLRREVT